MNRERFSTTSASVSNAIDRLPPLDSDGKSSKRQPRIDGAADGIAHDAPGPRIQNDGDIDEAADDGDVGNPKLVGSVQDHVMGKVWKDRLIVIVRRQHP